MASDTFLNRRVLAILLALVVLGNVGFWAISHRELLGFKNPRHHLHSQHIFITRNDFIDAIRKGNKENVRDFISLGYNASTQTNYHIKKPETATGKSDKLKAPRILSFPLPMRGIQNTAPSITPEMLKKMPSMEGTSALLAAIDGGDSEILNMVLATLPQDAIKRAQVVNLQDINRRDALIAAAERNDVTLVNQLLSYGADPALINSKSESPLIIAIRNKYSGLTQPLIDADIKLHASATVINTPDDKGATSLSYAIAQGDEALVKTLINAKADVISPNLMGVTPLMAAEQSGNFSIAKLLLDAGAKIDVADKFGNTPLTIAIAQGNIEFAQLLLTHGADPDFQTVGKLPLQIAIEAKPFNAEFFKTLLSQSKKVDSIGDLLLLSAADSANTPIATNLLSRGVSPQMRDSDGKTLLYHALDANAEDIALMLLDKGADAKQIGVRGVTPLECAIKHNEIRAADKLLSLGASSVQKNSQGMPVATMSMYLGETEILQMLLAHGANIENDKNSGLVYWAGRDGGTKMVALLLEKGANPDAADSEGNPALWLAASTGPPETLDILIKYRATLDTPPDHKETVTHRAAVTTSNSSGSSAGAAPRLVTEVVHNYGIPPLSIACRLNRLAIVKKLVTAGAGLEVKDVRGMTPLAHAAFAGNTDIVEYLLSKGADKNSTDAQKRNVSDLAKMAPPSEARTKILTLLAGHP